MVEEKRKWSKLAIWGFVLALLPPFFILIGSIIPFNFNDDFFFFPLTPLLFLVSIIFSLIYLFGKKEFKGKPLAIISLIIDFLIILFFVFYILAWMIG